MENLTVLQEQIGYHFKNRALLLQALTHSSFASGECPNNERLEFLGDAVLELCVSKYLFATYPSMAEGVMSRVRASAVCEGSLYRAAQPFRLGEWLRLGNVQGDEGRRPSSPTPWRPSSEPSILRADLRRRSALCSVLRPRRCNGRSRTAT